MRSRLYFEAPPTWDAARAMLTFEPIRPAETLGRALEGLRVHVRDHRQRDLPVGVRTLEAHYGTFVVSQARRPGGDAARLALEVSYGAAPREARVLGRPGRVYELGPEPPPDDVDGRSPAVVVWHEDDLFLLVASGELPVEDLLRVAASMHAPRQGSRARAAPKRRMEPPRSETRQSVAAPSDSRRGIACGDPQSGCRPAA